ncbi:hypothetical protein EDD18DRAFT_1308197 [Armillaria luteobubalina]|uniref:Splicing factor 3A subunit 3 n=1 Tax=Armillaria luteobubalina TaxID=153913 RepID=A0AA39QCB0_9AGAR|nr:hypothetical protein EDD18DRAFT_1308197 [Armillaria luteobubalina]
MDSIIEVQRQTHEEIERFERALYTILSRPHPTQESRLQNEHKASQMLDRISSHALSVSSQPNDLSEFYARLVKIQEHHSKYPDSVPGGFGLELEALLEEPNQDGDDDYEDEDPISLLFSGEEAYGKYLDLYANHTAYCNIKNVGKRPGYLQYLDLLMAAQSGIVHQELSKEARFTKDYENYISNLYTYLLSFAKRTQPLVDVNAQQQEAETEFSKLWDAGELKAWEESSPKVQANGESGGIWCSAYPNGTHTSSQTKAASPSVSSAKSRLRNSALYTHLSTALLTTLVPLLNDTKSNVERRFSLTAREREQELLDQAKPPAPAPAATGDNEQQEEEEEERIYNPLKLPLGWDGKPIPYWLYKLHGLGVEYRCEICSDHVYMGRKNFDRHFQVRISTCFWYARSGLPNTKHFHEITRIEDALSLAEKLKQEGRHEIFEQETMEELEDEEGNVYNRKTYEDLKKQGLI